MGNQAFSSINASLAEPAAARGIVLAAPSALDAVMAAGISLTQEEQAFLQGIPSVVWTQLRSAILAAIDAGRRITLAQGSLGAYSLTTRPSADTVELVLNGPYPASGS